jgi:formylglycine-generating enzyme required for sulfatase activity
VTFAQWDACVAAGGCGGYRPEDQGWGRGSHPAINVSWDDARAYVRWLGRRTGKTYRLLSEAEWEYTARAGTTTPFHTGPTIGSDQANYDGSYTYGNGKKGVYRGKTIQVGSFPANAFGLHDMHGNVWEWVADCYSETYASAPADGSASTSGNCSRRVLRGGSWGDEPRNVRSANRLGDRWAPRGGSFGFRISRTLSR